MRKKNHILYYMTVIGFLLGIQNGYIALWKDGVSQPIRVFPYRAALLPEADQTRLSEGIRISSKAQLMQIIEDYLS